MAHVGKKQLSEIGPDHPFAQDACIILGGPALDIFKSPLPKGRHGVTVTVSWGYELHSVKIGAARWRRIRRGEAVLVRSKGWYEGKSFPCFWLFDDNAEYSLVVNYGNDGGTGFNGDIRDATIEERGQRQTLVSK